jgi:alanyl-tRNA synthetase
MLINEAQIIGDVRLVSKVFKDREPGEVRALANKLTKEQSFVVLFGLAGDKSQFIFAASPDIQIEMNTLLNSVLPLFGNASGGGSSKFAQGGGPAASPSQIKEILDVAKRQIA